jgi:hypothetical protein
MDDLADAVFGLVCWHPLASINPHWPFGECQASGSLPGWTPRKFNQHCTYAG